MATHPTQFLAPWMRYLNQRLRGTGREFEVWYATLPDAELQGVGFGKSFSWDVDVLSCYPWRQLGNRSARPSLDGFFGTRVGRIRRRLCERAPSAVLVTGWQQLSLLQVAIACKLLGIPCLIRAEASGMKPRGAFNRFVHRSLVRLFDRYLTIGESNRDYYLSAGVTPGYMHSSPYFVDNQRLGIEAENRVAAGRRWRQQHDLPDDRRVVLFVGKLQSKKRPADLLDAASLLAEQGVGDFTIVFAGDGELRESLEYQSQELALSVLFTGFVNQTSLPALYSAANCLVLPSNHDETWGLVVNEAMNFSLPVVVSDQVGCGPDLVIDHETGYRYPCGDTGALAAVLGKLIADEPLRCRLGRQGMQRISEWSIEAATDGLLDAWQQAASGR